jgi:hypothetical protein
MPLRFSNQPVQASSICGAGRTARRDLEGVMNATSLRRPYSSGTAIFVTIRKNGAARQLVSPTATTLQSAVHLLFGRYAVIITCPANCRSKQE